MNINQLSQLTKDLAKLQNQIATEATEEIFVIGKNDGDTMRMLGRDLWSALNAAKCHYFTINGLHIETKRLKEFVAIDKDVVYTFSFDNVEWQKKRNAEATDTAVLIVGMESVRGTYRFVDQGEPGEAFDVLPMRIGRFAPDKPETKLAAFETEFGFVAAASEFRAAMKGMKSSDAVKFGEFAPLPVGHLRKALTNQVMVGVFYNAEQTQALVIGANAKTVRNEELTPIFSQTGFNTGIGIDADHYVAIASNELVLNQAARCIENFTDNYDATIEVTNDSVEFVATAKVQPESHQILNGYIKIYGDRVIMSLHSDVDGEIGQSESLICDLMATDPNYYYGQALATRLRAKQCDHLPHQLYQQYNYLRCECCGRLVEPLQTGQMLLAANSVTTQPVEPMAYYEPAQVVESSTNAQIETADQKVVYVTGKTMAIRFFAKRANLPAKKMFKLAKNIVKHWPNGEVEIRPGLNVAEGEREKFWETAVSIIWDKLTGKLDLANDFFSIPVGQLAAITRPDGRTIEVQKIGNETWLDHFTNAEIFISDRKVRQFESWQLKSKGGD